jgi:hypothetical protein
MYKQSYPTFNYDLEVTPPRDISKWVATTEQVYRQGNFGIGKYKAIEQLTKNWDQDEKYDYLSWLRYYENGDHLKYKNANFQSGNGYFIPMEAFSNPNITAKNVVLDFDAMKQKVEDESSAIDAAQAEAYKKKEEERAAADLEQKRKEKVEKTRKQIISRLDSLERLVRSHDGQALIGNEFSEFFKSILDLKTRLHTIKASSLKLIDSLIIREANILTHRGFTKSASIIKNALLEGQDAIIDVVDHQKPIAYSGVGVMNAPVAGYMSSMVVNEGKSIDTSPLLQMVDEFCADDMIEDVYEGDDSDFEDEIEDIIVNAQAAPEATQTPATPPATPAVKTKEDILATPSSLVPEEQKSKDIDSMLNSLFSQVTLADITAKGDAIAAVLKLRELPRQLSMFDMMLSSKGLSGYFPELSEMQNSALDFHNYAGTRIDKILMRLKGSTDQPIDLRKTNVVDNSPETTALRDKLKTEQDAEAKRKEKRKEEQNKAENETLEMNMPGATPEAGTLAAEKPAAQPAPATPVAPKV